MTNPSALRVLSVLLLGLFATGCKSTYYSAWQKLGYEKRDILVSRVKAARDEQQAAKEQFKTTLQKFQEVTNFKGGELEAQYNKLNSSYEKCEARANDVSTRIQKVETVAGDMFKEWAEEIKTYDNPDLKRSSEQKLAETRDKYAQLILLMKKSESKMKPVLVKFHDNVLYLKHNLNAAAIASLQATAAGIDADVQSLIKEMESSIAEADAFVKQIK